MSGPCTQKPTITDVSKNKKPEEKREPDPIDYEAQFLRWIVSAEYRYLEDSFRYKNLPPSAKRTAGNITGLESSYVFNRFLKDRKIVRPHWDLEISGRTIGGWFNIMLSKLGWKSQRYNAGMHTALSYDVWYIEPNNIS